MRVLIVDDSRTARMMLKRALPPSLTGDVCEAAGGSEAISRVNSDRIDLMFLDLTMPDVDGYQVLKTLQDGGRTPPTIVVSADVQPLAQARVRQLGAMAFVKKSLSQSDLMSVLAGAGLL
jgi:two-component system chemotaxis response regulator CheY